MEFFSNDNVNINLSVNGNPTSAELNKTQREVQDLEKELKFLKKGTQEYINTFNRLEESNKKLEMQKKQLGLNGLTLKQLRKEVNRLEKDITSNLTPGTDAFIKKTAELKKVRDRYNQVRAEVKGFAADQSALGKFFTTFKNGLFGALGAISGFIGLNSVIQVFQNFVQTNKEFEASLSNLSAITGATGEDLDFLSGKAKELAANSTLSATQTVEAFKLIGSAKPDLLANSEALASVTKETIALSEASNLELKTAASSLTGVLNQFNLSANESSRVVNALAAGSKAGAVEVPQVADAILKFGVNARAANVSVEQSVGLVELLGEKGGLLGTEAGTALRNFFGTLASGATETNPEVVGLDKALENLAAKNLTSAEAAKLFGRENANAAITIIQNRDRFNELTKAVTGTQTAYEQQRINNDNLQGDLKSLSSTLESLILSGGGFNSVLRFLLQTTIGALKSFKGFLDILFAIPDIARQNQATIAAVVVALLAFNAQLIISKAQMIAYRAAVIASSVANRAAAIATGLWNLALRANPIGFVVGLIASLVAGVIYAYQNFDTFRASIQGAWAWVKSFAGELLNLVQAIRRFDLSAISESFQNLGSDSAKAFNEAYDAEIKSGEDKRKKEADDARKKEAEEKRKKEEEIAKQEAEETKQREDQERQRQLAAFKARQGRTEAED